MPDAFPDFRPFVRWHARSVREVGEVLHARGVTVWWAAWQWAPVPKVKA